MSHLVVWYHPERNQIALGERLLPPHFSRIETGRGHWIRTDYEMNLEGWIYIGRADL